MELRDSSNQPSQIQLNSTPNFESVTQTLDFDQYFIMWPTL